MSDQLPFKIVDFDRIQTRMDALERQAAKLEARLAALQKPHIWHSSCSTDQPSLQEVIIYWRGCRVTIDVDSRGLSYAFEPLKDENGIWRCPPHTTQEEFSSEFDSDPFWSDTAIGRYLVDHVSGSGEL
jgi:hypothetical protein